MSDWRDQEHIEMHRAICEAVGLFIAERHALSSNRAWRRAVAQNGGLHITAEMVSAALAQANVGLVIDPVVLSPEAFHHAIWPDSDLAAD